MVKWIRPKIGVSVFIPLFSIPMRTLRLNPPFPLSLADQPNPSGVVSFLFSLYLKGRLTIPPYLYVGVYFRLRTVVSIPFTDWRAQGSEMNLKLPRYSPFNLWIVFSVFVKYWNFVNHLDYRMDVLNMVYRFKTSVRVKYNVYYKFWQK